ncbi:MAG: NUDIX domain-containing protein, partial [Candidatus Woesearchaeota archaeon]|nr:NUDIX domain-containing protein [Candidatus Woesearchaeota archaeon]
QEIFALFLNQHQLSFAELEKLMQIRSNKLAYHLACMKSEGVLSKKEKKYQLSEKGERYLPLYSHIIGKQISPLPVVLVAVLQRKNILLIKRKKRPYKNYWSMIGGRILLGETVQTASQRLVREKTGFQNVCITTRAVLHEIVRGNEGPKYSFILFFTKTIVKEVALKQTPAGELAWFPLNKLPEHLIHSDKWLLKNKIKSRISVTNATMIEEEGKLSSFEILNNI